MAVGRKPKPLAGDQGRATNSDGQATGPSVPQSPSTVNSQNEHFSFRWGIPILDGGFTDIPNFFLDNYVRAGVTGQEFLAVVHLARYQYNTPGTECRPSMHKVARQMGIARRSLRRILARLEAKGVLVRHYRTGQTTVYDFSGFSKAVLTLAGEDPGVWGVRTLTGTLASGGETVVSEGGRTVVSEGGGTVVSPKEEHVKRASQEESEEAAAGFSLKEENMVTCSIHNCPMEQRSKDGAIWFSHRLADGSWCKGGPTDVQEPHVAERSRYAAQFYLVQADA